MNKNLVLERSQKQYIIRSVTTGEENTGIDAGFIRTVNRNLMRLYQLYVFVFARGKRAMQDAEHADHVVKIESGTKRQSEQYALFYAVPAALYAKNAHEVMAAGGTAGDFEDYRVEPVTLCAVEDVESLTEKLAGIRCRTQKDFIASMRVLCRAVVTVETPFAMTIDVKNESDMDAVLDFTSQYMLPEEKEEAETPAADPYTMFGSSLPAPVNFAGGISKRSDFASSVKSSGITPLMGAVPTPAVPRMGAFAAPMAFDGARVHADAFGKIVTDHVKSEDLLDSVEIDVTTAFDENAVFDLPQEKPAPTPKKKKKHTSPFWIGHETELEEEAPKSDAIVYEAGSMPFIAQTVVEEPVAVVGEPVVTVQEPAEEAPAAEAKAPRETLILPGNVIDIFEETPVVDLNADAGMMAYRFDYFADHSTPKKRGRQLKSPFEASAPAKKTETTVPDAHIDDLLIRPAAKHVEEEKAEEVVEQDLSMVFQQEEVPAGDKKMHFVIVDGLEIAVYADRDADPAFLLEEAKRTAAMINAPMAEPAKEVVIETVEEAPVAIEIAEPQQVEVPVEEVVIEEAAEEEPVIIEIEEPQQVEEPVEEVVIEEAAEEEPVIIEIEELQQVEETVEEIVIEEAVEEEPVIIEIEEPEQVEEAVEEIVIEEAVEEPVIIEIEEPEQVEEFAEIDIDVADEAPEAEVAEEIVEAPIVVEEAVEAAPAEELLVEEEIEEPEIEVIEETIVEETAEVAPAQELSEEYMEETVEEAPIDVPLFYSREAERSELDDELDEMFDQLSRPAAAPKMTELDALMLELEQGQDTRATAVLPADDAIWQQEELARAAARQAEEEFAHLLVQHSVEAAQQLMQEEPAPEADAWIDIDMEDEEPALREAVAEELLQVEDTLFSAEENISEEYVQAAEEEFAEETVEETAEEVVDEPFEEDVFIEELDAAEEAAADETPDVIEDIYNEYSEPHTIADESVWQAVLDDVHEEQVEEAAPYAYDVEVLVADEVSPQEAARIVEDYRRAVGIEDEDPWQQVRDSWNIPEVEITVAEEVEEALTDKEAFIREEADAIAVELADEDFADVPTDDEFAARSMALYDQLRVVETFPEPPVRQDITIDLTEDDASDYEIIVLEDEEEELPDEQQVDIELYEAEEAAEQTAVILTEETIEELFDETADDIDIELFEAEEEIGAEGIVTEETIEELFDETADDIEIELYEVEAEEAPAEEVVIKDTTEDIAEDIYAELSEDVEEPAESADDYEIIVLDDEEEILPEEETAEESAEELAEDIFEELSEETEEVVEIEEIEEPAAEEIAESADDYEIIVPDEEEILPEEMIEEEAEEVSEEIIEETVEEASDYNSDENQDEDIVLDPETALRQKIMREMPESLRNSPMAARAAALLATMYRVDADAARIGRQMDALNPQNDEEETRAIFGRTSVEEELPEDFDLYGDAKQDELPDVIELGGITEEAAEEAEEPTPVEGELFIPADEAAVLDMPQEEIAESYGYTQMETVEEDAVETVEETEETSETIEQTAAIARDIFEQYDAFEEEVEEAVEEETVEEIEEIEEIEEEADAYDPMDDAQQYFVPSAIEMELEEEGYPGEIYDEHLLAYAAQAEEIAEFDRRMQEEYREEVAAEAEEESVEESDEIFEEDDAEYEEEFEEGLDEEYEEEFEDASDYEIIELDDDADFEDVYIEGVDNLIDDLPLEREEAAEEEFEEEFNEESEESEEELEEEIEEEFEDEFEEDFDEAEDEEAEVEEDEDFYDTVIDELDDAEYDAFAIEEERLAREQERLEAEIAEQERLIAESRASRAQLDELAAELDRSIARENMAAQRLAREQVERERFERTQQLSMEELEAQQADYQYAEVGEPMGRRAQGKKIARHRNKRWFR